MDGRDVLVETRDLTKRYGPGDAGLRGAAGALAAGEYPPELHRRGIMRGLGIAVTAAGGVAS